MSGPRLGDAGQRELPGALGVCRNAVGASEAHSCRLLGARQTLRADLALLPGRIWNAPWGSAGAFPRGSIVPGRPGLFQGRLGC